VHSKGSLVFPGTEPYHRAGILVGALAYLIPETILLSEISIDFVAIREVIADGSVHFPRAKRGIKLLDCLRGVALLEGDHHGVERNTP
jgi:hypothetical protein